ncbi:MAG: DUF3090 family protein [Dehalococcoidia bacterium]
MEERRIKYPLGTLAQIDAETFGEPGSRTFRLVLQSGQARSYVWLEKEQLFQLGVYLQEALQAFSEEQKAQESRPSEPEWSGGETSIEFKARQMYLNHDSASNAFFFQALEDDATESGDEPASVSFWITTGQAEAVAQEALRICAAGRPPCFLCGMPINPDGHVCPRANGHAVLESG